MATTRRRLVNLTREAFDVGGNHFSTLPPSSPSVHETNIKIRAESNVFVSHDEKLGQSGHPGRGCGGSSGLATEKVHGKVTLDGKPLPDAGVEFQPEVGRPSAARTDPNGDYALEYSLNQAGALQGHHIVRITTGGERPDPATGEMKKFPELLPAKYNTNSELKQEIKPGDNEINFELQSR